MTSAPEPYEIAVPQAELDDLRARLHATRWPDAVVADASRGTAPGDLRRLVAHWADTFDWRAAERRLNAFAHVRVEVDGPGTRIHALRAGTPGATPLLLLHGWPDGFVRFEHALPLLAARFDIVVPSIPGYGFSDRPTTALGPAVIADRMVALMGALGFDRFGVHGADIGTHIADQLASRHPEHVTALHLGDIPFRRMRTIDPADLDDDERAWMAAADSWDATEGAYAHLQRTKPQTIAAALDDSPAGFASWVLEKLTSWSDGDEHPDVFDRLALDDVCTLLTIYWVTQTAGSAAGYYFDARATELSANDVVVPTGVAQFPADILHAPRRSAERWFRVARFTDMPRGGHFGPWEQPREWAAELIAFFDQIGA